MASNKIAQSEIINHITVNLKKKKKKNPTNLELGIQIQIIV